MDSKKVIEQLVKIAEKQQKIIARLAQQLPGGGDVTVGDQKTPGPTTPPLPGNLVPTPQKHQDLQTMVLSVNPQLSAAIVGITFGKPGEINVSFKPEQATQANYDAVLATIQQLENDQKIQGGHKVHVV